MTELTQSDWIEQKAQDPDAVILDVRTDEEVAEGFIEGAIHIDIYGGQAFLDALEELDKSKSYFVYCRSGNRSGQACAIMASKGFEKTFNLIGGVMEWEGPLVEGE